MTNRKQSGFTLVELMVVLAIVGILAMIAIPSYNASMTKTRRADGQAALMDVMAKEERYFTENNTYTTDLADLPADASSDDGFYTVSADTCGSGISSCVILTATPGAAQTDDGALTLDSRGQKLPADKW